MRAAHIERTQRDGTTAEGIVVTTRLEAHLLETSYRGRIVARMADQVRRDIEPHLRAAPGMDWLVDTSAVTGLEPAPRASTLGVVELFRKLGGRRIAAVAPSSSVGMLAAALAFATRMPLRIFDSRVAALAYLAR